MTGIEEIRLEGSPFERGLQHGRARGAAIRAFLARQRPAGAERIIDDHREAVRRSLPALADEVAGLAAGAGVSVRDALFLQIRREVLRAEAAGCTTIASTEPRFGGVVAQTVDLAGGMTELGLVLRHLPAGPGDPEILLFTFAGLLGYLGLNSHGLAVGINMVHAAGWKPGVSPYLLVREILRRRTTAEALDLLATVPRSSSRALTLCDGSGGPVTVAEMTGGELELLRGPTLLHTNHYLHPALRPADTLHVLSRRSSKARLVRLAALAGADDRPVDAERIFGWLSDHGDHPICIHGDGDPARHETVAAVALYPREGKLLVRIGPPCQARTRGFRLGERPSSREGEAC